MASFHNQCENLSYGAKLLSLCNFLLPFVSKNWSLKVKNGFLLKISFSQLVLDFHIFSVSKYFFVSKNLSLMEKKISSSKSVSIKSLVFKHKMQIYHFNMINFHTQCANLSYCIWYQVFISFQFVVTVCQQKLITQGKNSFPPENEFKSKWCKTFIFFPRFLITFCQKILSLMVKNDVFSKISISQKCSFQTKDAD